MQLSVVVILYNEEEYLEACVDSILRQTKKDIEVILVDDGSTDRSGEICDKYRLSDSRVKVIHQHNQGMIQARYNGVLAASGEYITFVDADDFINKESYIYAEPYMKDSIDVISFNYNYYTYGVVQERKQIFDEGLYDRHAIETDIYPKMIWDEKAGRYGMEPSLWSKVIKKKILLYSYTQIGGRCFNIGEDRAIIYPIIRDILSIQVLQHAFYNYRVRSAGNQPAYVKKDDYLDEVYALYAYLKEAFSGQNDIIRQIELSYVELVTLKRKVYGQLTNDVEYIFPFDKVNKNEKIVVYGAGVVGRTYIMQLKKLAYCRVLLWCDKNWEKYSESEIKPISDIQPLDFDKIVIAVSKENLFLDIKKELMRLGVKQEKIVF